MSIATFYAVSPAPLGAAFRPTTPQPKSPARFADRASVLASPEFRGLLYGLSFWSAFHRFWYGSSQCKKLVQGSAPMSSTQASAAKR